MSITTRVTRQSSYRKVVGGYRTAIERVIASSIQDVMNTAKQSIQQHGSSDVTYKKYNPKRTHTASAPKNPPNSDTGFLVSNIHAVMDADKLGGAVESRADYSVFLEFGTSNMQERPFLQPALEENKPKIRAKFKKLRARFT